MLRWFTLLLWMAAPAMAALSEPKFIFTNAPFASAHASSVVELRDGDFLACWFGGTQEGKPDVAIWSARLHHGAWSAPIEFAREFHIATYNPVLFHTKDNRLWFYYKFGPNPASWSAARRWSDDDGQSWSPVEHLPAGVTGPIRTKPLVMEDGTVVSGTSVESYHTWAVWIERSTNNGQSWRRIGPITVPERGTRQRVAEKPDPNPFAWPETYGIIQPTVIQVSGKKLRLYARSTAQIGRICVSDSNDAGLTWTDARPLDLPNPNSGIDAIHLRDGRYVMVYNDSTTKRTPLVLALSGDGEHFQNFRTLESGEGEFSYPAMIQDRDGNLDITYTWNRRRIKFVRIPLSEIHARSPQ
jgi:predicted neuraminidase